MCATQSAFWVAQQLKVHVYLELLPTMQIPCFVLLTCSDITVLTPPPPPSCIILLCFLYVQYGTTPVLLAAFNGHTSIVDLLVDQYHCSLTDMDNVSALDSFNVAPSVFSRHMSGCFTHTYLFT